MEEISSTLIRSLKTIEHAEILELSLAKILKSQAEEKLQHNKSLNKYFQR